MKKSRGGGMVRVVKRAGNFVQTQIINLVYKRGGFGVNELLGIAAALIIAAFIIIPQLSDFAEGIMTGMTSWWTTSIKGKIFTITAP